MTVYNVGGINPLRRFKTLADALTKAKDDDTIILNKNISESVTINKNIILKGNKHVWDVPEGKSGFTTDKKLELYDIHFDVPARSNAIVTTQSMLLHNITTNIIGPVREFYPTIFANPDHPIVLTIENCDLMKIILGEFVTTKMYETKLRSYFEGEIMLGTRSDMNNILGDIEMTGCVIKSTMISGNAKLQSCTIDKYFDVDGVAELDDCILSPITEVVKKNKYKKEFPNGPLADNTNSKYCLAARPGSTVILNNYNTQGVPETYLGVYATDSTLTVDNTNISGGNVKHAIKGGTITFANSEDDNYWGLDKTTSAFVRSTINSNSTHVSAKERLDALIGQQTVKDQVNSIMNTIEMNRATANSDFEFSYNMIFAGEPGTGKSTIAKIVAESLFEIGAIPQNKFTTATSDEFVKGYVGQTGENTRKILDAALGGVLFIDEAYELSTNSGQNSFNSEVLSVLIRYMEEHRSDLVVIAAGYSKEMKDFLASNVGLTRRFQWIQFEDYTTQELTDIFEAMRSSYGDTYQNPALADIIYPLFDKLVNTNLSHPDVNGRVTNGGNGGLVRNVYQQIVQARNNRFVAGNGDKSFTQNDIVTGFKTEINKALQRAQ